MNRCGSTVHWWDCALNVRCRLHAGHTGPHADGIRWFDDYGLQVPYSPQNESDRLREPYDRAMAVTQR